MYSTKKKTGSSECQMLAANILKCEIPLHCKGFSHFFQQKITVYIIGMNFIFVDFIDV